MNIHPVDDVPFYSHPRRLSHSEKSKVNTMIDEMLEQGILKHSESPYASPIVLVKKKNGQKWFTLLDLESGFHHLKIANNCFKYT